MHTHTYIYTHTALITNGNVGISLIKHTVLDDTYLVPQTNMPSQI